MNQVKLISSDGQEFLLDREFMSSSNLDISTSVEVLVPTVTGKILFKIIEYCVHHAEHPTPPSRDGKDGGYELRTDDIVPWDLDFCKVDKVTLFELILAAHSLGIEPLVHLTCKTVANMIKGKTPEEIRVTFNINEEFSPEEEEKIFAENLWMGKE